MSDGSEKDVAVPALHDEEEADEHKADAADLVSRLWHCDAEEVFNIVAKGIGGDDTITKEELVAAHEGDFKIFAKMDTGSDDGIVTKEEFLQFLCISEDERNAKKDGKGTKYVNNLLHTLKNVAVEVIQKATGQAAADDDEEMDEESMKMFGLLLALTPEWEEPMNEACFHKDVLTDIHDDKRLKKLRGEGTPTGWAVNSSTWLAFLDELELGNDKDTEVPQQHMLRVVKEKIERQYRIDVFNLLVKLTPEWETPFTTPHFHKNVLTELHADPQFKKLRGAATPVGWAVNWSCWLGFLKKSVDEMSAKGHAGKDWLQSMLGIVRTEIELENGAAFMEPFEILNQESNPIRRKVELMVKALDKNRDGKISAS